MKHKLDVLVSRVRESMHQHKKRWIIGSSIFGVVLVVIIGVWIVSRDDGVDRTSPNVEVKEEEEPKTVASPLTGLQVSKQNAKRPVTAIVIENSPDARPQSSLSKAGVVFEAIAEGGITRYLALYQETKPDPIGPVRSLRPYFVDWVLTFDASIAHIGGSAQALQEARDLGLKDLDQFSYAGSYYRTSDRYAPHNVYTDFGKLDALNKELGYTSSKFDSWPRKEDSPAETPKATNITIPISSYLYESGFTYAKKSNSYLRTVGGEKDIDREPNKQINPKVVIVLETTNRIEPDGRYQYDLVGKGKVTVFQDGIATVGTWKKSARDSQFMFIKDNGEEIQLNAGQTWVSVITPGQALEY